MKFLCIECDEAMKLTETQAPDGSGSLRVLFACPRCGRSVAMLTNPWETEMVSSLGVRIGPSGDAATAAIAAAGSTVAGSTTAAAPPATAAEAPAAGGSRCPFSGVVREMEEQRAAAASGPAVDRRGARAPAGHPRLRAPDGAPGRRALRHLQRLRGGRPPGARRGAAALRDVGPDSPCVALLRAPTARHLRRSSLLASSTCLQHASGALRSGSTDLPHPRRSRYGRSWRLRAVADDVPPPRRARRLRPPVRGGFRGGSGRRGAAGGGAPRRRLEPHPALQPGLRPLLHRRRAVARRRRRADHRRGAAHQRRDPGAQPVADVRPLRRRAVAARRPRGDRRPRQGGRRHGGGRHQRHRPDGGAHRRRCRRPG